MWKTSAQTNLMLKKEGREGEGKGEGGERNKQCLKIFIFLNLIFIIVQ